MKRLGIFAAMFLGLVTVALAQNQVPLGDVVRQPRPTKKASRVITNEEIPSRPEETSTPVSSANSTVVTTPGATGTDPKSAPAATAASAAAPGSKDSPEVVAIKGRLSEVAQDELNLSSQIREIQGRLDLEPDSERRAVYTNMLNNQKRTLGFRQQEKAELKNKLEAAQKPK